MPHDYAESQGEQTEGDLSLWWKQFNDPLLDSLITEALEHNFDLKIAVATVRQARAEYQIQAAPLWPWINLSATETREKLSETLTFSAFQGPPFQTLYQIGFDATWEIDIFGKNQRAKEMAYYSYQAQVENMRDVQVTLLAEVAMQYINIRSFQKRLKNLRALEKDRSELVHLNRVNFKAGLSSDINAEESDSLLEQVRAQIPQLETALSQATHSLAILLGRQPENFAIEEGAIPLAKGKIPIGLPSDLLKRRPDLRSAERQLWSAMAGVKLARAELFPTFSLTAFFGYESNFSYLLFKRPSRLWNLSPNMTQPIFQGGSLLANLRAAKAVKEEMLLSYEQAILSALKDVEDALVAYANEEVRQTHLVESLSKDKTAHRLEDDLYTAGLSDYMPALQTDIQALTDEDTLIQSEQALMLDLISLYKAVGGGW
jgi:NodT family efflux transporter outer membrane factor (OMF) lipoprotein